MEKVVVSLTFVCACAAACLMVLRRRKIFLANYRETTTRTLRSSFGSDLWVERKVILPTKLDKI